MIVFGYLPVKLRLSERHQACLFGRVVTEVSVANVSSFVLSRHKYSNFSAKIRCPPLKIVKRKKNGNDVERNEYLCNLNCIA